MPDMVNPYANPYLPSFVNQRPRINEPAVSPVSYGAQQVYSQINSVKGFDGARAHAAKLSNGSSEIVAEDDPNLARVYIVAKDPSGNQIVEGFNLVHVDEPKPITMDDLNSKMNQLLERMDKMEEEKRNAKSGYGSYSKDARRANTVPTGADSRNVAESGAVNAPKQSAV